MKKISISLLPPNPPFFWGGKVKNSSRRNFRVCLQMLTFSIIFESNWVFALSQCGIFISLYFRVNLWLRPSSSGFPISMVRLAIETREYIRWRQQESYAHESKGSAKSLHCDTSENSVIIQRSLKKVAGSQASSLLFSSIWCGKSYTILQ